MNFSQKLRPLNTDGNSLDQKLFLFNVKLKIETIEMHREKIQARRARSNLFYRITEDDSSRFRLYKGPLRGHLLYLK